jgi:hypothetical protein
MIPYVFLVVSVQVPLQLPWENVRRVQVSIEGLAEARPPRFIPGDAGSSLQLHKRRSPACKEETMWDVRGSKADKENDSDEKKKENREGGPELLSANCAD